MSLCVYPANSQRLEDYSRLRWDLKYLLACTKAKSLDPLHLGVLAKVALGITYDSGVASVMPT